MTQKGDPYIKIFSTLSAVRCLIYYSEMLFALIQWNRSTLQISLFTYRGHLLVLVLYTYWCSPSLGDFSTLRSLQQKLYCQTRNTFCGTWYLPYSPVHNERTVPVIVAGCMAHVRNGYISTSGLKSDVTIVFLDPDFL